MNLVFIEVGILLVLSIVVTALSTKRFREILSFKNFKGYRYSKKYNYNKKQFFMTRAEHEFFDLLISAIGERYYVFPQVHLSTILDHKIKGQSFVGAFSHINQKSVDFVLCDKNYISPKLAIELDDSSHDQADRVERDQVVDSILKNAGMKLIRFKVNENLSIDVIKECILNGS